MKAAEDWGKEAVLGEGFVVFEEMLEEEEERELGLETESLGTIELLLDSLVGGERAVVVWLVEAVIGVEGEADKGVAERRGSSEEDGGGVGLAISSRRASNSSALTSTKSVPSCELPLRGSPWRATGIL